jgi:periodic tryptophan protein 1
MEAVTYVAWIPAGVTPPVLMDAPVEEEMEAGAGAPGQGAPEMSAEDERIIKEYGMENYDKEDEEEPPGVVTEDPYQTGPVGVDPVEGDDEQVRSTDLLLMVGKTGDVVPMVDILLFDAQEESVYVHHELMIPSFPLCIKWLDFEPRTGATGSFAAVAGFEPQIEIWNLNIAEPTHPAAILQFHENAVPGLAWNLLERNLLLTASIDTRAAIWNLETCEVAKVYQTEAPCKACEWNPVQGSIFGVGTDRGGLFYDALQDGNVLSVLNGTEVEAIAWLDQFTFLVGDNGGNIVSFDTRQIETPLGHFQAHAGPITSISVYRGPARPNRLFATTGEDGHCRLWNIDEGGFSPFAEEDINGKLYTSGFSPDRPGLLAYGGDGDGAHLWDITNLLSA